ncbi:hypothetical protein SAMN04489812_3630 [Microlunatus soli]|uniref:Uncharacterized protein n=1 Tax=Microlunatus soli TaxID=630515 RepID=A0A1H1WI14_9ACTN|nr:hypothetical protein SAMN04489812_3630 [Microlunatus soli]
MPRRGDHLGGQGVVPLQIAWEGPCAARYQN